MTWNEKLVVHLLLFIARIVCGDDKMRRELADLSERIRVHTPNEGK